jgi:hypothetical protein
MMTFNEPKYLGLTKVISGGQCGADLGGITAALEMGVPTGGVAPLHFRTQWGNDPTLGTKFGLTEDASPAYPPRTQKNIEQSDGTLIIASNWASPGCTLTYNLAKKLKKPVYRFCPLSGYTNTDIVAETVHVMEWLTKNRISVLNVAGNRDRKTNNFHFMAALKLVTCAMNALYEQHLLLTTLPPYSDKT